MKEIDNKELVEKIHDYIRNLYKAEYNGRLEVINENGMYTLILGVPNYLWPTNITLQTTDSEEFLDFVCNELKTRNYLRVYFYKVIRKEKNEI